MSVIDLTDAKRHLGITTDRDDDELQDVLDAAEAWTAKYLGLGDTPLGVGTRTVRVYPNGRNLVLPATRLQGVTTVTDPDGTAVEVDDRDLNLLSGIVRVPYVRAGAWTVAVTIPTDLPPDVRFAVLVIADHLWQTQRMPGQAAPRPGFGNGGGETPTPGRGYAIPNRARDLLAPYRQVPVA